MENNADDIELTGGVRRPQNRTSPQRRYLSTNVHDRIYLKSVRDHASRLLDVCTSYCRAISCAKVLLCPLFYRTADRRVFFQQQLGAQMTYRVK